jgi:hypothetical protein
VLDDAVDEIIEMVHRSGGRVVTVQNGTLAGYGSVGALLEPYGDRSIRSSGSSNAA